MKVKVSNYISQFWVDHGITDCFTVTGGGAMHLNDSFGHQKGLKCWYNHHEQGCAVAAEGYARYSGKIAGVCVTTGPGGTNALTGVCGAWMDSIPMFVISGQVKFSTTIASTKVPLRQLGDQEFNIIDCAKTMTKYAVMVTNPYDISYHLERALYLAIQGRRGPVWLDIPLNIQGSIIEVDKLRHYDSAEDIAQIPPKFTEKKAAEIIEMIKKAKRPVIFSGTAIRYANAHEDFLKLIDKLQIPVATEWNGQDVLWENHPLYCGIPGTVGTRGGNFVVQNADLLLILGNRLNIRTVSYNWENFAPKAFKILVDIDPAELQKPTLIIDYPIYADVKDVISAMNVKLNEPIAPHAKWLEWCRSINKKYPACLPEYYKQKTPMNPYVVAAKMFEHLDENDVIVSSNATAAVCFYQACALKKGERIFSNSGTASMGYGLPAALGVAAARKGKRVICIEGDGSLEMNVQELETVSYNHLNVKIFLMNNHGYHSIRQTQTNLFAPPLCGVSPENGVGFPLFDKLASAYQIPYLCVKDHDNLDDFITQALSVDGPVFVECVLDPSIFFAPKLSSKRLEDGTMISPPLDDMYPFLPTEEMQSIRNEVKEI